MIELDDGVPTWWDRLNDEQRPRISQVAQTKRLDDDARRVLADTGCPMRPTAIKYDDNPEAYEWQEPVREYVLLQAWWDHLDESDRQIARRSLHKGYELEPEAVEMFTRTRCPIVLAMHGYPPDPNSWIVSLPDRLHEFISSKDDPPTP